ncbi:MAG TPA: peptidoglycan-binding domain-containing protein [Solirubrobacteraceae bacterium]|nr:peptidoglycan-binding domain-containing protein [Solirubrobacteraceae bacterium]
MAAAEKVRSSLAASTARARRRAPARVALGRLAARGALAALAAPAVLSPAGAFANSPGGTVSPAPGGGSRSGAAAPQAGASRGASASSVRIVHATCVPAAHCDGNPHHVSVRGTLAVVGVGLKPGMVIAFPRSAGARISSNSPGAHLRASGGGLVVTVPASAHSGRIIALLAGGRHSSSYGPIAVFRHALHPPFVHQVPAPVTPGAVSGTGFEGQGMWIWYVSRSSEGEVAAIVARAHASGVSTVFIKSSDGSTNYWSQFSKQLVSELHANGLKACGWQYVYGTNPTGEAHLGAEAVANGADCLVIDAESEYEGHYAAAQTYLAHLRAAIGPNYPVGLASFPYVSYHPKFPYSVFLGPGGAQYNAPQMYWHDIGVSVDTVYANTYIANRIYSRPLFPLGQTYGGVSSSEILRFREEAVDYGATGVSFWDWQETNEHGWSALAAPLAPLTSVTPNTTLPELEQGMRSDPVLWMQEHLASAIPAQQTTGIFDANTAANLRAFQSAHSIEPSGVTDAATWAALLALQPVAVNWTGGGPST